MKGPIVDEQFKDLESHTFPIVTVIAVIGSILFVILTTLVLLKGNKLTENTNSYLISINTNEFYERYNSGEKFVLLLGRPGCSHCVAFKPIITRVANEKELKVYYLDTDTIETEDDWYFIWELVEQEGTPTVAIIQNKALVDSRSGEMTRDDLIYWFTEVGVL